MDPRSAAGMVFRDTLAKAVPQRPSRSSLLYRSKDLVFICAFVGAMIGFLWYNAYPAQVFMGDTGSLTIGGIIGVCAIIIHKELMLPILCGIFFVESLYK